MFPIIQATINGVRTLILTSPDAPSRINFDLSSSYAFTPESASLTLLDALYEVHAAADMS